MGGEGHMLDMIRRLKEGRDSANLRRARTNERMKRLQTKAPSPLPDTTPEEMGLSILFISHDMRVVYQLCDRVMIMKDGTIVESGDVDTVYFSPQHEYTKELLEAAGIGEDEA